MGNKRHPLWARIIFETPELMSEKIGELKIKIKIWKIKVAYRLLDES